MNRPRVLFDLTLAGVGWSGIANTCRREFALLSGLESVRLEPMLMAGTARTRTGGRAPLLTAHLTAALNGREVPSLSERVAGKLHLEKLLKAGRFGRSLAGEPVQVEVIPNGLSSALARRLRLTDLDDGPRDLHWAVVDEGTMYRTAFLPLFRPPTMNLSGVEAAVFSLVTPVDVGPTTRKIVKIHDLIPFTDPDLTHDPVHAAAIFDVFMQKCIEQGTDFVTISETTRDDLLRIYPDARVGAVISCYVPTITRSSRSAVPILERAFANSSTGDTELYMTKTQSRTSNPRKRSSQPNAQRLERQTVIPETYFVVVGPVEPKKNHSLILDAFEQLWETGSQIGLVLAGGPGWRSEDVEVRIATLQKRHPLGRLHSPPSNDLWPVLQASAGLLFPSIAEGFGLPPIEAMMLGRPAIVSDIAALRETCGDAALYCNPYSVESLLNAMSSVLDGWMPDAGHVASALRRVSAETTFAQWEALLSRK